MGRIARAVMVGHPHHITQRGNYRQEVFGEAKDYTRYLQWLKGYSERYSLNVWAYCLMSNHVHFIAVPMCPDLLSRTFNTLHMRYSQYYNRERGMQGHLWQGRFFSCVLDEAHLYASMHYVENNPVRAGIVTQPAAYKWSSALSHEKGIDNGLLSKDCHLLKEIKDWGAYLRADADAGTIKSIRENTKTGRPCGDETFVRNVESALNRRLGALRHGRPKK